MSEVKRIKIQYLDDSWTRWLTIDEAKAYLVDNQVKACIIEECMSYDEAMSYLTKLGI